MQVAQLQQAVVAGQLRVAWAPVVTGAPVVIIPAVMAALFMATEAAAAAGITEAGVASRAATETAVRVVLRIPEVRA